MTRTFAPVSRRVRLTGMALLRVYVVGLVLASLFILAFGLIWVVFGSPIVAVA